MFSHRPVWGWGLGTFPIVYPSYRSFYTNLFVNEAHNDYAQLLVETGLLGFALMLWFLFVCTGTDFQPLAVGNSNGMARSPLPLCWGVREFCSIASWISICKSPRMLRCFMCFAGWPLLPWPSYPSESRAIGNQGIRGRRTPPDND